MDRMISAPLFAASWLVGMLLMMELGRRAGLRLLVRDPEKGLAGLSATEGTVFGLGLGRSLLAGCRMAEGKYRSWIHILGFTAIMVISLFVILDIEYPRAGFIRLDMYDQVLVELRGIMK